MMPLRTSEHLCDLFIHVPLCTHPGAPLRAETPGRTAYDMPPSYRDTHPTCCLGALQVFCLLRHGDGLLAPAARVLIPPGREGPAPGPRDEGSRTLSSPDWRTSSLGSLPESSRLTDECESRRAERVPGGLGVGSCKSGRDAWPPRSFAKRTFFSWSRCSELG